jgi:hypothetical protein
MTHAAPAVRHGITSWTGPVLIGLGYGLWASNIQRRGDAVTGGDALLAVVAGLIIAVAYYALRHAAPGLPRELRALAWGSTSGIAVGFLHSLANTSILWSLALGVLAAAGVTVVAFYRFYVTED